LRCRLGLDDTDHVDEGCTTSSFDELLSEIQEAMNCDILERRLVRLWPFAERRTRGNGALGAIIDIPDKNEVLLEKICNDWFDRLLTKVAGYPPSKIPAAPCLVISFDKAPEHWYWDAVRGYVNPENILREAGNTGIILLLENEISGVVGACAAISWESNPHSSWELIAWRDDSSLGSERRVSSRSVSQLESLFPGTFLNRDPTKGKGLIAPRTPCPVLYGIRGSSSSEVERAHIWLQSEKGVESCKSYAIHRSNQISDDHIESTRSGLVICKPRETKGGHARVSVYSRGKSLNLVAFREGGPVNRLLRTLEPGDKITWVGLRSPDGSIHLERLRIDSATPRIFSRPICCRRTMRSSGRNQGLRCLSCGRKEKKTWYSIHFDDIHEYPSGKWLEPTPSNRRHLSRPLSQGLPGIN
jgi:tRNA(Ile2)-agmatinylcytidine synthase